LAAAACGTRALDTLFRLYVLCYSDMKALLRLYQGAVKALSRLIEALCMRDWRTLGALFLTCGFF
jgi:hypothetical protein